MVFRGDIAQINGEQKMAQWEMALYKYSKEQFSSDQIEILVCYSYGNLAGKFRCLVAR